MMAMTSAPFFSRGSSLAGGRRTRRTMSALFSASDVTAAPAAVYSASGTPAFTPAPGITATSAPSATSFLTVSGTAATRGSPASVSAATAIFMRPPTAVAAGSQRSYAAKYSVNGSTEEIRHSDHDEHDDRHDHLHQRDEILIGLFVGRIIVAICRGVFDLSVIGHFDRSNLLTRCGGLSVIAATGQRDGPFTRAILPSRCVTTAVPEGAPQLAGLRPNPYSQDNPTTDKSNAQKRTERAFNPDRTGHADGATFPLLLAAGSACRGTAGERLPASPRQDHVRTAGGV